MRTRFSEAIILTLSKMEYASRMWKSACCLGRRERGGTLLCLAVGLVLLCDPDLNTEAPTNAL